MPWFRRFSSLTNAAQISPRRPGDLGAHLLRDIGLDPPLGTCRNGADRLQASPSLRRLSATPFLKGEKMQAMPRSPS